ncbi:MAG TPA: hypothetical protein VLA12_02940, partial [Planctomycetaceae bacterium]|nr:hypothetical protein [Planctomycetaceae bacterium]
GLSVNASYHHTNQDIDLAPDVTLDRIEAGVEFEIGLFRIAGSVFRTSELRQGGLEYDSTGFRAAIRRNFGGWLPIVSAPERRGVVR